MQEIKLTLGQVAIVDDEDYSVLSSRSWYANRSRGTFYALSSIRDINGHRHKIPMHRVILGVSNAALGNVEPGIVVDHVNGNGLDNRRSNLRRATLHQNARNSRAKRGDVKGVYERHLRDGSAVFDCGICVDGARVHLGTYKSLEDASAAYDHYARIHYGEFARVNGPPVTYESRIQHEGCSVYMGVFATAEEAAMAYNQKAMELLGDRARLNIVELRERVAK